MRFITLFFTVCYSQITQINLETNPLWKTTQQGALNYAYMITGSNQQYLSVLITLSEPNSNFTLVAKSGSAVIDFNQQFIQGTTIDIISAKENRLTRNLNINISENILPIYISTFDQTSKSKHDIIIKSNDKKGCPNDCSGQGECLQYGCKCFQNFIGNDCHQTAKEINGTDENQLLLKDSATFFYLKLNEYQGQNMEIKFSTIENYEIKIYLFKSQSLAHPLYSESQFDEQLFEQKIITNQDSKIIQFEVIEQIDINNRLVFVALVQNNSAILNILVSQNSNDETSLKNYEIALIVILPMLVVGGLGVLGYYCYYCQYYNRQLPNPIHYHPRNDEIQNHEKIPNEDHHNLNQNQGLYNHQNLNDSFFENNNGNFNTNVNYNQQNFNLNVRENNNMNGNDNHNIIPNNNSNHGSNDNHNENQDNQQQDDICLICNQNLMDGGETSQTTCKHIFHKDCLTSWGQDHQKCPKCEAQLALQIPQAQICQDEIVIVRFD